MSNTPQAREAFLRAAARTGCNYHPCNARPGYFHIRWAFLPNKFVCRRTKAIAVNEVMRIVRQAAEAE